MARKSTLGKKNRVAATPDELIAAAMAIAAKEGWQTLCMTRIAREAAVDVAAARTVFASVHALMESLVNKIDQHALQECTHFQDEDTVRDKLFALLMARLDYLSPHKAAFRNINLCQPPSLPTLAGHAYRLSVSMALMLRSAGVSADGPPGISRTKGLGLVYLWAFRTWLHDETEDLAPTMAVLDKGLSRAEMLASRFPSGRSAR